MLHILLLILKIIGIIIAVILGILVLAVCVVLFVPVRYQMTASCDGTLAGIHAKAKVTWLMHLFRLYISYENRRLSWRIGIAWKCIRSGREKKKMIKTEVKTNGKEVEELWEDLEDDLEEETGKECEEWRETPEVDEEEAMEEISRVCKEKQDEPVRKLEEEWDRLMEGYQEEQKDQGKESGEAVEEDPEEPEDLLARLEQEVERILENEEILKDGKADAPAEWKEASENIPKGQKEIPVDSRQGQKERDQACEDGCEKPKTVYKDSGKGEREACEDGGKEPETAYRSGGKGEQEACADSGKGRQASYRSGAERDEGGPEHEGEHKEGGEGSRKGWKSAWRKLTDSCRQLIRKVSSLYQKLTGIPEKIKTTMKGIGGRIEALSGKKDKILDFLTDEVHRKAFLKVKDEVFRLLRKLGPKKIQGKIRYGFEDPYLTGKLLAGFSMAYPFLGDHLEVYPDFGQRILKGRFEAAGRLRISSFAKLLWNLVWCREVRMTYRHVRKFEL